MGEDATDGIILVGNGGMGDGIILLLDGRFSKIISGSEVVDHTIVSGYDNTSGTDYVKVLLVGLTLFSEHVPFPKYNLSDEIGESGHFVRLKV